MIGVVGAGRMGGAMIRGWIADGIEPSDLIIADPRPGEDAQAAIAIGASTKLAHLSKADTVLLSVKPQIFPTIVDDLAARIGTDALIISIMAGTSLDTLRDAFPGREIIRAMPNTPSAIGRGITGLYAPSTVSKAHTTRAETLLSVSGPVVRVAAESDIDRVTAVSGSGPAYVFHLVEALAEAGEGIGLSADAAAQLARETIIGAAHLLAEDGDASALRRAVTSPNGTTQAALEVLMVELPDLMSRTVTAAFDRAQELAKDA